MAVTQGGLLAHSSALAGICLEVILPLIQIFWEALQAYLILFDRVPHLPH